MARSDEPARPGPRPARAPAPPTATAQSPISIPSYAAEISHAVVAAGDLLQPSRLPQHRGDLLVVQDRLVVEQAQVAHPRHLAELDADDVARVAPVLLDGHRLGERVHGVEDDEVGVAEELDEGLASPRASSSLCSESVEYTTALPARSKR